MTASVYKNSITIELNQAKLKAETEKNYDLLFKILDKSFQLINTELLSLEEQLSSPYYFKNLPDIDLIDFTINLFKQLVIETSNAHVKDVFKNNKTFKYLPIINDLLNSAMLTNFDKLLPIITTLINCITRKLNSLCKFLFNQAVESKKENEVEEFQENLDNLLNLIYIVVKQFHELMRCDNYMKLSSIMTFKKKEVEIALLCDELNLNDDLDLKKKYLFFKTQLTNFLFNVSINFSQGDPSLGNHIHLGTLVLTKKETSYLKKTINNLNKLSGTIVSYFIEVLKREPFLVGTVFSNVFQNLFQVLIQRNQFHQLILIGVLDFKYDKKWQFPSNDNMTYKVDRRALERTWKVFIKNIIKWKFVTPNNKVYNKDQWKYINQMKDYFQAKEDYFKKSNKNWRLDQHFVPNPEILEKFKRNRNINNLYSLQNNLLKRKNNDLAVEIDNDKASHQNKKLKKNNGIAQIYSSCNAKDQFDMTTLDNDLLLKICVNTFMNDLTFQPLLNKLVSVSKNYLNLNNDVVSKNDKSNNPYENKDYGEDETDEAESDNEKSSFVSNLKDDTKEEIESKFAFDSKGNIANNDTFTLTEEERKVQLKFLIDNLFTVELKTDAVIRDIQKRERQKKHIELAEGETDITEIKLLNLTSMVGRKNSPNVSMIIRLCSKLNDDSIRSKLQQFIISTTNEQENLMLTVNYIIEWMSAEWIVNRHSDDLKEKYYYWLDITLADFLLKVDNSNKKEFIQLFSGLPSLNYSIFKHHFNKLLLDPYKQQLGYLTLKYLLMFRPTVKKDIMQFLKEDVEELDGDVKQQVEQLIVKFSS
ncbi:hypothetical protein QEN19_003175 [Hanseniaspora menglaensis]